MHLHRWRRASVAFFFAVAALIYGCSTSKVTAPNTLSGDALIAKVDVLLNKPAGTDDDIAFIQGLTPAQLDQIMAYYSEHPRQAPTTATPNALKPERQASPSATTGSYVVEKIECYTGSGGWHADAAYLTSLCGGDTDYMFGYFSIPNAYNDRSRLTARTNNPVVILAMTYFGGYLSARVYSGTNHVFTCVGKRIDWLGITPSMWNNAVSIYKR